MKLIIAGIGTILIVGFLFVNGVLEFNPDRLDKSLENTPKPVQDVGKKATEIATKTTTILRQTIDSQLKRVQSEPLTKAVEDASQIPKRVQEENPLNEKPVINKSELELQIHQLTNQARLEQGLDVLGWDGNLADVARSHSQDMASRDYFSHITPEGKEPTDRAVSQNYICKKIVGNIMYSGIAENILQTNLYDAVWYIGGVPTSYDWNTQEDIAESTVDGWMNSPGHRENILTGEFDREGIGVEITPDDKVYITQNFC